MTDRDTNHARAVRYRQLALAEVDRSRADLLFKIADEADREEMQAIREHMAELAPWPPD